MANRDAAGRWIIPQYSGLPCLILADPLARSILCGYPASKDILGYLTASELLRFKEQMWVDGWEFEPMLRCWMFGNRVIYGMWGFPDMVAGAIRKLARVRSLQQHGILIPLRNRDVQTFFIVGARSI